MKEQTLAIIRADIRCMLNTNLTFDMVYKVRENFVKEE